MAKFEFKTIASIFILLSTINHLTNAMCWMFFRQDFQITYSCTAIAQSELKTNLTELLKVQIIFKI